MGPKAGSNPYVGPRPFETGEPLFGRDRELRELLYLLSGERIVLVHSPSGAGKSSLIQAGLIPRLRARFDVWRPTRVGHPPPPDAPPGSNRYALSAILGLEQGIPAALRRPAPALAGLRLAEYVASRPRRPGAPEHLALIFDQFEEVLTADPLALAAKHAFFTQLGDLLQDPRVWALFSLREDYLAPLDPYAQQVPTHLRCRYRLDMLGLDAAREAIACPASGDARRWTEPALERVVRDLAAVKLQQADGSFAEQTGHAIEPMQLQVVCRGLWDRMPADDLSIDLADVEAFGDVTRALASYYGEEVRRIAGHDEAAERVLREWVGDKLITGDGIRRPVLRGAGASEGLANDLVARLVDAHLVRAEHRGGATWYELAHDRLVAPLRADNERWSQANLQPAQIQAALWARQSKPAALLLSEEALAEAERWAAGRRGPLAEPDLGFLAASRAARAHERALRDAQAEALAAAQQLAARQRRFTRVVSVLLLASLVGAGVAAWQTLEAGRHAARAADSERDARRMAARAEEKSVEAARQTELAQTLLKMSGARALWERGELGQAAHLLLAVPDAPGWVELAHQILRDLPEVTLRGHPAGGVSVAAWSPDSARIASGAADGSVRVWAADGTPALALKGAEGLVTDLNFSPDGARILARSLTEQGATQARAWTLTTPPSSRLLDDEAEVAAWTWSPDGRRVVTLAPAPDGAARVWSTEGTDAPILLVAHEQGDSVRAAAFSPDGAHILAVCDHGVARVWTPEGVGEAEVSTELRAPEAAAWSPDGLRFMVARDAAAAGMWTLHGAAPRWLLRPADPPLAAPGFSHNHDAEGGPLTHFTGGAVAWTPEGTPRHVYLGRGPRSPDGLRELRPGLQGTLLVRPAVPLEPRRLEPPDQRGRPEGRQVLAAWDPSGSRALTWSRDGAWLWDPRDAAAPAALTEIADDTAWWAWSPDGAKLLASSSRGVQIWSAAGAGAPTSARTPARTPAECGHGDPSGRAFSWAKWSPDGGRVAWYSAGTARCALVWADGGTGEPVVLRGAEELLSAVPLRELHARQLRLSASPEPMAWSSDGRHILTSSATTTHVWRADGTGEARVVAGHDAAWSPDGQRFVVTPSAGRAQVWTTDAAVPPAVLGADEETIEATSWSPDGRHILVRARRPGAKASLRLWTPEGRSGPSVPQGEEGWGVWSPDGKRLFLLHADRRPPRVWAIDDDAAPLVLAGHDDAITAASWSVDGRHVVTTSGASGIRVWAADGSSGPLDIPDVGAPELSRDGRRLLVDTAVWHLTVPDLRRILGRANRDCVAPTSRVAYLGEDDAAALAAYRACERARGRAPFFTSARSEEGALDDPQP